MQSFGDGIISDETRALLEHSVGPHVDSFNYFLDAGIDEIVHDMQPMCLELKEDEAADLDSFIKLEYEGITITQPMRVADRSISNSQITPRECREGGISYTGATVVNVNIDIGHSSVSITTKLGDIPIMVMSEKCHLKNHTGLQLLQGKEEATEVGGYFIQNGIERVIRLLQVPRRNQVMAIERNSYKNRGPSYSALGVAMRCCRPDQSSVTITLHYLNNGGCTLKFVLRKQEFLLPVVMVAKALVDISDKELFDRIVQDETNNTFLTTRLELLLRDFKSYNLYTKHQCRSYLGSLFRGSLGRPDTESDEEAGLLLISRYLFVHTDAYPEKAECLLHMMRKLFSFAQGRCLADNADAVMNHELLLPGHLITMYLKEKMEDALINVRTAVKRDYKLNKVRNLYTLYTLYT